MVKHWRNRILLSAAVVITIILVYAEIFLWSMIIFENREVTFAQSLQVVVESLTTSGYGGFSPWESDFLNYFILFMNLTGVVLVFIAFPVFFLPFLREAIGKSPPKKVSKKDHVIICSYSNHSELLIKELISRNQDYVILDPDQDRTTELFMSGINVMDGDPESESVLNAAGLKNAKAVIVDSTTDKNISTIFSIRNLSKSLKIIAVLPDKEMEIYHKLAGADETISPRELVGKSLAVQVPAISVEDSVEIDDKIELIEIDIGEGSELVNKSIDETHLLDQYNMNIIGVWLNDKFLSPVPKDLVLSSKSRLLIAGNKDDLETLSKKAETRTWDFATTRVLLIGYGLSGQAAHRELISKNISVEIMDCQEKEGVTIVGDIRDPEPLKKAGVDEASAIIITIQDDTVAVFGTLLARSLNSKTRIIVRANKIDNVNKLYDAGADYVQSLAIVTGRMLTSCIFEDETSLAADKQINLVKLPAGKLSGSTLSKCDVRAETGCTILAVIRDHKKINNPDPQTFEFQDQDDVIIAGTDESVRTFEEMFVD